MAFQESLKDDQASFYMRVNKLRTDARISSLKNLGTDCNKDKMGT